MGLDEEKSERSGFYYLIGDSHIHQMDYPIGDCNRTERRKNSRLKIIGNYVITISYVRLPRILGNEIHTPRIGKSHAVMLNVLPRVHGRTLCTWQLGTIGP
jgi:hypothetical protein